MPRKVAVLGSTGSIGTQTLDVVRRFPDRVAITALAAGKNLVRLREQIEEFGPSMAGGEDFQHDITSGRSGCKWLPGERGMMEMATHPDVDLVVVATTGRAGLLPTLAALEAGKLVALANKEVLVAAGALIRQQLASGQGRLVPIDSEHSAIWQCLLGEPASSIERLTLTASGGALRDVPIQDLGRVTPEQALLHPTWRMGAKITIDSATLMNKGLEVLEARWLFDLPLDRIDVVHHPQSLVHSLVTFADSSIKAQVGLPDMRLPIQYALSHPDRWENDFPRLDLASAGSLEFGPIELDRYPALAIALAAGRAGGVCPTVLCAADEIAVDAFLAGRIGFADLAAVVQGTLDRAGRCDSPNLDDILEADERARLDATEIISHH